MSAQSTIVSLNGQWDLAFDPKDVGKDKSWFKRFPKKSEKMAVPGVWEQIKPGYDGVGWYRKTFDVKKAWTDKVVRLKIGAAIYYSECWLNGQYLGKHEGGFTPFEFDINKTMNVGENELVVRIINPPINEPIEGLRAGAPLNQSTIPVGKAAWYYNYGGIWQDVELIITEKTYVDDVFVKPDINKKTASLEITVVNKCKAGTYNITCAIKPTKKDAKPVVSKTMAVKLKKGVNKIDTAMVIKDMKLWALDDPFLYWATVEVACSECTCHRYDVRFGMREFNVKGGTFTLNGQRVKLLGFLQQGHYARTLACPHDMAMARKELKLLKDAGYNYMRVHLKPADPAYLDLCDEMGLLIQEEPAAAWVAKDSGSLRRCLSDVKELLIRDRNHPSIILWCLLNEAYHFLGFTPPEITKFVDKLGKQAKEFDPTRVILDTSGGLGNKADASSRVMVPNSTKKVPMTDVHGYCGMPLADESIVNYRTMGKKNMAFLNSEFGAPDVAPDFKKVMATFTPAERKIGLEDYQLHKDFDQSQREQFNKGKMGKIFGTVEKFNKEVDKVRAEEVRHTTGAQRVNDNIDGLALCQLADASGELFGATDIWRNPKKVYHEMTAATGVPALIPEVMPRRIRSGDKVTVRASLINEHKVGRNYKYNYKAEIVTRSGKVVDTIKGSTTAKNFVDTPVLQKITPNVKPGQYALRTTLMQGRKVVYSADMSFLVVGEPAVKVDTIGCFDKTGVMAPFAKKLGLTVEPFSNNYRNKDVPQMMDGRGNFGSHGMIRENGGQLKKMVQTGGCAVLFEPDPMMLYEYVIPTLIRYQPVMRTSGYITKHPVFQGLPSNCVIGYEYSDVAPNKFDLADDVLAAGGEIITGGLSSHMWTRPANYFFGVSSYVLTIGRGKLLITHLNILDQLKTSVVAQNLFANMINWAATQIKPGGNELLLSRCIDPLSDADIAGIGK